MVEAADEVDRPLDMSTGRRASPPPYPAGSSGGLPSYPMRYPSPPDYASARPSVITCASSLRSSPAPSCPSPCGSTSSSTSQPRTTSGSPPPPRARPAADVAPPPPQRREIISSGSSSSSFVETKEGSILYGGEEKLVSEGETFNYLGGGGGVGRAHRRSSKKILPPSWLAPLKEDEEARGGRKWPRARSQVDAGGGGRGGGGGWNHEDNVCTTIQPPSGFLLCVCVCVSGADHSALSHFDIEGRETIQVKKNGGFFSKPMLIADWEERRPFFSLFFFFKKRGQKSRASSCLPFHVAAPSRPIDTCWSSSTFR